MNIPGFDANSYLPSRWDNRHLLTFTGGYKFGKGWELAARVRILGGAPFPSLEREASENTYPVLQFDYSNLGDQRLDLFNSLDLRIDKKWNFSSWSLNTYIEVTNILGSNIPSPPEYGLQRNEEGMPVEPRKIVEIEDLDNSSVIPTIGIVVDI